jgi:hypothetical protein
MVLACVLQALIFLEQGLFGFHMLWIDRNASHRAHLHTLWLVKMADAFGALGWVDFVNFRAEIDRLIGAFRFAHIAIDAFISDHQSHKNLNLPNGWG